MLLVAAALVLFLLSSNLPMRLRLVFLGSYGLLLFLSLTFSIISDKYAFIKPGLHQRLLLAPNLILGWMLVTGIRIPTFAEGRPWRRPLARLAAGLNLGLVVAAFFWGIQAYPERWVADAEWTSWPQQVQAWRVDSHYSLRIQPEGWVVNLAPR